MGEVVDFYNRFYTHKKKKEDLTDLEEKMNRIKCSVERLNKLISDLKSVEQRSKLRLVENEDSIIRRQN